MKILIYLGLLSASCNLLAVESITWQYRNDKTMEASFSPSLAVAKKWASEHYKNARGIIRFEFAIWKASRGHKVMITPIYEGETVVVDGDMCVHTDEKHKYVKSKQCMAP